MELNRVFNGKFEMSQSLINRIGLEGFKNRFEMS